MGSSPLTRGKRPVRRDGRTPPGLIPAHAGKTGQGARPPGPRRAHPRSRGENLARTHWGESSPGSSPLTRGKPSGAVPPPERTRAHPRSRGENIVRIGLAGGVRGSSPLTRGKPCVPGDSGQGHGLIPAHAGKTSPSRTATFRLRAHPRSRGENTANRGEKVAGAGSSPLTRGKHLFIGAALAKGGLIPAHAGKTHNNLPPFYAVGAHPRSRGENSANCTIVRRKSGSSPLTRGKRRGIDALRRSARLIPAHAGKT